jgi:hypothetical protein
VNIRFLCGLITLTCAVALQSTAHATFHLMQIEQIIVSVDGDDSAQAIQLRMRSGGQNFVSQAKLVVTDASGGNAITVLNIASDVDIGNTGSRVLIASSTFPEHTTPHAIPDFFMTNLIPDSYFAAGSLMFQSDSGTVYWRVSWGGSAYTGPTTGSTTNDADGQFGPPFNSGLPSCGVYGLRFQNSANALSTNNKADYRFDTQQTEQYVNNGGNSYTVSGTLPTVTASVTDGTASESPVSDTGKVRFTRTGCTDVSLNVVYSAGGTAVNGEDYEQLSGTVKIPVGSFNAGVTLTPINDSMPENNETANLKISNNANYLRGSPNSGTITIISNE